MRKLLAISIALLTMTLVSATVMATAQESSLQDEAIRSNYLKAQADSKLTAEEKIKNTIDTYFILRYEGQTILEAKDFAFLAAEDPKGRSWAREEQDKREIELLVASLYRLNYIDYKYSLEYESISVESGIATVLLRESHTVVFEATAPEISRLGGLEHTITLRNTGGKWVIVSDEYQDELSQLMECEPKEQIIDRVERNHAAELELAAEFESTGRFEQQDSAKAGAWHSYNRTAAVNYADTWGEWRSDSYYYRNPAYYNYDNDGGDCTNFASQVIYAGAPQMDSSGSYQWFYISANNHSTSWTSVSSLNTYLINNTWTGPYGSSSNMCSMVNGDIIQLYNGSYWFHTLVVVYSYYPYRCWNSNYISYNCHTTDRYHYPLSFVSGYTKRYIHIEGWRD